MGTAQLRRRIVLASTVGWFMSYARPLSWMALMLIKKLLLSMLSLIIGFVIAVVLIAGVWYVQDLIGWRP